MKLNALSKLALLAMTVWSALVAMNPPKYVPDPSKSEFAPGQVWKYRCRESEESSRVVVLDVEAVGVFLIVHVSIEGLRLAAQTPGAKGADSIAHAALFDFKLKDSVLGLVEVRQPRPSAPRELIEWKSKASNERFVHTGTVRDVVARADEAAKKKSLVGGASVERPR